MADINSIEYEKEDETMIYIFIFIMFAIIFAIKGYCKKYR